MFVLILVSFVAACTAAPLDDSTTTSVPKALEAHLINKHIASAEESQQYLTMKAQFYNKFPPGQATQGVQGNEYKLTIPVNGLEEKDVKVTALKGVLFVEAVDNQDKTEKDKKTYIDLKQLPSCVNVAGNWTIDNGVLEIVFPLIPGKVCEEVPKVPVEVAANAVNEGNNIVQSPQDAEIEAASIVTVDSNGEQQLVPILYQM